MPTKYTAAAAQAKFPEIVGAVQAGAVVGITKRGKTVAFVVSPRRAETMIETAELLANPKFLRAWKAEKSGKAKCYPASTLAD